MAISNITDKSTFEQSVKDNTQKIFDCEKRMDVNTRAFNRIQTGMMISCIAILTVVGGASLLVSTGVLSISKSVLEIASSIALLVLSYFMLLLGFAGYQRVAIHDQSEKFSKEINHAQNRIQEIEKAKKGIFG